MGIQETHYRAKDAKSLDFTAHFKTHNSTYDGDGNRQKGASIFFSDKFWVKNECLYNSDNGDLIISKLEGPNLNLIVCNVYAPNNHNETYFGNMKDILLDIQVGNPNT